MWGQQDETNPTGVDSKNATKLNEDEKAICVRLFERKYSSHHPSSVLLRLSWKEEGGSIFMHDTIREVGSEGHSR